MPSSEISRDTSEAGADPHIEILALTQRSRDITRFLQVAHNVYRDDPHWVAPLWFDARKVFLPTNPFFEHADIQLWIARHQGRDVGRIAGIHNRSFRQGQTALFGFFESVRHPGVSGALFEAVYAWAQARGARSLLGPMNPSNNDECGLLIDGFDSAPLLMMPYNPKYYVDHIADEGFAKAKDLYAYRIIVADTPIKRLEKLAAAVQRRYPEVKIRPVLRRNLNRDLPRITEIYNEAWEDNWGFVPMTRSEVKFMANRLKSIVMEGLVWLAETPEEPVGFILTVPDFNEAIEPLRGRLLTPKVFKFIPYVFGWKRLRQVRLIALGVKKKYRGRGLEAVMFAESFRVLVRHGIELCEASWILEDNQDVQRLISLFGGERYKTYRLFERALDSNLK